MAAPQKPKKPPACDACKARRVMCHAPSVDDGNACPRCVEKNIICTRTPLPRGRPRKHPLPPPGSEPLMPLAGTVFLGSRSGDHLSHLTPEFIAHCFDVMKYAPQLIHPLVMTSDVHKKLRGLSYQVNLLPPQARVLALCVICSASRASYHPVVLGDSSPRPQSFFDLEFFQTASKAEILDCGTRRAHVFELLRTQALKAAWDEGIVLQASNENAASCYLLDLMDQSDSSSASRPWATAYMSHIRVLAPLWHSAGYTATDAADWAGFLMGESLLSTRNRTTLLVTPHDQLLLSGPEAPSLEAMLETLEKASSNPSFSLLWGTMRPFLFHVPNLARILHETISGDYARLHPLSESAVIKTISSLSIMYSIISIVLERVDNALRTVEDVSPHDVTTLDEASVGSAARAASYGAIFGFIGLVLPFYRELEYREQLLSDGALTSNTNGDGSGSAEQRKRQRLRLLRIQAHGLAVDGARLLARAIRYLPSVHYTPSHWGTMYDWARFCADEADADVRGDGIGTPTELSQEQVADLETIVKELILLGYSLDAASAPPALFLIERLEQHIRRARGLPGRMMWATCSTSESTTYWI
ncbi:hypothetical protein C8F01DRAFT_1158845 [Mycena amicta]|nr:hypothetical protein C8F01DRAFT_1158845 [Mycena amicta]